MTKTTNFRGSKEEEPLISLNPKSSFELLLWEKSLTKELREELRTLRIKLGELQSDYDELVDLVKTGNKGKYVKHIHDLQMHVRKQNKTIEEKKLLYKKKSDECDRLLEKLAIQNLNKPTK